ncbi:hypothetical protein GCM10009785_06730 [Brooklawnia cerclae]|uniref:Membrane protein YphA (DoxX/SURF4 family) n=1 Tax=Brooklawnia cerclae TaxID=349934 RepID=A0ABX0SDE3_9ACTN|nr:DoxX family membrane protein [Brooklawnia cerclae]NIH56405.1 putative membrane protein YphA (DoxX/SURF4 family) [Brooklawnia cerclae]
MSLLRFAGRVLYSAFFVADGYQLLTKPDQHADELGPTVDRVVPAVQSVLPPDAADRVPEDLRTWTRLLGIAQIVGGIAYATGFARRPGAVLLTVATVPRVVSAAGSRDSADILTSAALLGAGVVATQDTNGRPGLRWRAQQSRAAIEGRASSASKSAGKQAGRRARALKRAAKRASAAPEKIVKKVNHQVKGVLN